MLTVKEINEVSFGKAGFSGYKPEDVDNFIDQVAASFQELLSQREAAVKQAEELAGLNTELASKNADSQRKLSILAQKVEAYRQEEEGIKEAILSAQRMSKSLVQEARQEADSILQDARTKAEEKLLAANEEARKITESAEQSAAKAAKEYAQQAEQKKNELEEIKKQVTAFRSSLLEMYKNHLECIDHIPTFRQKEEPAETPQPAPRPKQPEPEPVQEAQPAPTPAPQPERKLPEPPEPVQEYREAPAPRHLQPQQPGPAPQPMLRPVSRPAASQPVYQEPPRQQARTLNDTYNYVQEQLQPSRLPEDYMKDNDLSAVGIDLNAHSNIPEALRREKSTNYSNLPFGDGVEVDGRKRKR